MGFAPPFFRREAGWCGVFESPLIPLSIKGDFFCTLLLPSLEGRLGGMAPKHRHHRKLIKAITTGYLHKARAYPSVRFQCLFWVFGQTIMQTIRYCKQAEQYSDCNRLCLTICRPRCVIGGNANRSPNVQGALQLLFINERHKSG